MTNANLKIWSTVEKTDPAFTKPFKRSGGHAGTAINAVWLVKRATETFGPIGIGWGVELLNEEMVTGANGEIVHKAFVEVWYIHDGKRGSSKQFGQTMFVSKRKDGLYTDEDYAKKSLTDGMTKAMSWIGLGSDIHQGMYEDNKYVQMVDREYADKERAERELAAHTKAAFPKLEGDNVVQLKSKGSEDAKPTTESHTAPAKESADPVVDEDGVIQDDTTPDAPSDDDLENRIVAKINSLNAIPDLTGLMTNKHTMATLKALGKTRAVRIREVAKVRLMDLGWIPPKKDQVAS